MGKRVKQVRFAWRDGFRAKIEADLARRELETIAKDAGGLTAAAVVDASRPEDAVLHPQFEWDDFSAAEGYRRDQARKMIRAIVRVETENTPAHREYVLVRNDEDEATQYKSVTLVVQQPDLFADGVQRLAAEVAQARESLQEIESVARASGAEPERLARISMAVIALETASAAVAALH